MKIIIYMGHPAHFHLFKHVISRLKRGHRISILIKKKDILETLLKNAALDYTNILPEGRKDSKSGIAWGLIKRALALFRYSLTFRPDLLVGTSVENSVVGRLLKIPSINVNEDDASAVPLYAKLAYPLASCIVTPEICNNGKWEKKAVKYPGYHELAYLHPSIFKPDPDIVEKYFPISEPFFLIRFAQLTAHHDKGIQGINADIADRIVKILEPYGNVYITSERPLEPQFEPFRININPLHIHHVMFFCSLYIGDSQTMAAEAGVLGTPFIRFNDFVGRIGYLKELEDHYQLGYGITTDNEEQLYEKVRELAGLQNRRALFQEKKERMLADKINVADFLSWFIGHYPESWQEIKKEPGTANPIQIKRPRPDMTMRLSNYLGTGPFLFYAWLGFIVFSALIDYSLFIENDSRLTEGSNDLFVHALMYGIAAWLAAVGHRNTGSRKLVTLLVLLFLLGVCLESIQWWLPYRSFNPKDILANLLGIVAFFILRYTCRILVGRFK